MKLSNTLIITLTALTSSEARYLRSSLATDPHDCFSKEVWSTEKSEWCCDNKQLGCKLPTTQQPGAQPDPTCPESNSNCPTARCEAPDASRGKCTLSENLFRDVAGNCCPKLCDFECDGDKVAATDFASCTKNGNPTMYSFPAQCHDPISGKTFADEAGSTDAAAAAADADADADADAASTDDGADADAGTASTVPPTSTEFPQGCSVWFDGCNTCGAGGMCTMMACEENQATECREWLVGYPKNDNNDDAQEQANSAPIYTPFTDSDSELAARSCWTREVWSEEKRDWCCENFELGCSKNKDNDEIDEMTLYPALPLPLPSDLNLAMEKCWVDGNTWFDGCNHCAPGGLCTKMFCFTMQEPKCIEVTRDPIREGSKAAEKAATKDRPDAEDGYTASPTAGDEKYAYTNY